jgi:hypothetical protein
MGSSNTVRLSIPSVVIDLRFIGGEKLASREPEAGLSREKEIYAKLLREGDLRQRNAFVLIYESMSCSIVGTEIFDRPIQTNARHSSKGRSDRIDRVVFFRWDWFQHSLFICHFWGGYGTEFTFRFDIALLLTGVIIPTQNAVFIC